MSANPGLVVRIAWRSFLRHRRRSILTGSAIALGLAMLLAFLGLARDAHERMAELGIRLGGANVTVQGAGYQDDPTLEHVVRDPGAIAEMARAAPGVTAAVPRVHASGLISTGAASAGVAVVGVDPDLEARVSTIASAQNRVSGDYLRPRARRAFASEPADIYLGVQLARTLDLELGDRVVLTVSPRGAGHPASAAFLVRGIFRTGIDELDGFFVEIPLADARELFHLGDAATQVAVFTDRLDDTGRVDAALAASLASRADLEVLPWQRTLRELYEAIVLDDLGLYLMMAIVFVIVAIGIFNTVLMSVVERTRELGVMMAVGTSKARLFAMVLVEAVILALVASVVGLAIGLSIHFYFHAHGLDITSLFGDVQVAGVVISGRMYSQLSVADVVTWTAIVIAIVVASALYPAFRVTRLDPLEAMRHV